MNHVDLDGVANDPVVRFETLRRFVGLSENDLELIQKSVQPMAPLLGPLLEQLYDHILSFDHLRDVFFHGQEDPGLIDTRKEHLTEWFLESASAVADPKKFARFIHAVGHAHTVSGGSQRNAVPAMYMVAFMGYLQDALCGCITDAFEDNPKEALVLARAWHKFLVVQLEMMLNAMIPGWGPGRNGDGTA